MSKPLYLPKGWRAGPQKLVRKVYIAEKSGTYVKGRQPEPPAPPAPAPAP
ncbi:hypothetical protein [Variovorax sp.]|jgi:hypothetical protein